LASFLNRKSFKAILVAILFPGIAFFFLQQCQSGQIPSDSLPLGHYDSATYVGTEVCAACHGDVYETFMKTGMGSSFGRATQEKSSAKFGVDHIVYDTANDLYYKPFWDGEDLYIREFRLKENDTVHNRLEKIDYIIGSGHHTNSHLVKKGEYLVQAPLTFYVQDGKWDLPPGFEGGNNSRFTRIIDQECMSCHNALPEMKPKSTRQFASIPHGISCERCHGPGSVHAQLMSLNKNDEGKQAIVNPSGLTWERQIDLCQRCHLQGNNVLAENARFADFKPGMKLSDVFEIYLPEYDGDASLFNMANHSERFQMSACFKSSKKQDGAVAFTCISCHNPHVSVRETNSIRFNETCTNCHLTNNFCTEEMSTRLQQEDNCVQCHMPVSGTEDIPHVTVHDHKIDVPGSQSSNKTGKLIGLKSVNNPNPALRTQIRAYLTYFEKFDANALYRQKAKELLEQESHADLWVHYHYQVQDWQAVLKWEPKVRSMEVIHGVTAYRIGKAYAAQGECKSALEWLELSVQKSPDIFEYKNELAASLISCNRTQEALQSLEACLKQFPEHIPALNNRLFIEISNGAWAKAERTKKTIFSLNPDYIPGLENAVLMHQLKGEKQEAEVVLKRILELNPNHKKARELLDS
jgi:hypothetical protein